MIDDAVGDRQLLGSLFDHPNVDDWVRVEVDGRITVRTGKAELGQGIRTALVIIAAEELCVDPARIEVVGPGTGLAPDEGITSGSRSIEEGGTAVRQACAHIRAALTARAADDLGVPAFELRTEDGHVVAPDGRRCSYVQLTGGRPLGIVVRSPAPTRPPGRHRWVGKGLPRIDLASKIRGDAAYVHDMRLPGMQFARVIRPPLAGAALADAVPAMVGDATTVRLGNFLAVVAPTEGAAEAAAEALRPALRWKGGLPIPAEAAEMDYLASHVTASFPIVDGTGIAREPGPPLDHSGAAAVCRATYTKPFLLHASIGPSAAVALAEPGHLAVWTHSQGVGPLRAALAAVLGTSAETITVHHRSGPGCYGHNGADDAALDAALVAMARPGTPISLRWTRQDEHCWEPLGPAMAVTLSAGLTRYGTIHSWDQEIFTYPHGSRPVTGGPGSRLLGSWSLDPAVPRSRATPRLTFEVGGHRNADPAYTVGTKRIVKHEVDDGSPLRTSSLRSLGAFANVFAIESFVDELAEAAGADPLEFRLRHLSDRRARAVVEAAAELSGGLAAPGGLDAPGRGIAFARYESSMTYVAVVVEVDVDARSGAIALRHAWIAADAGQVIDPDGLLNQLEGGFVQAASWTLKEEVRFEGGAPGRDWAAYPILRFGEIPPIVTRVIDRPHERPMGAGEASCGPTGAAIANAVHQATGVRLRQLPFRQDRVRNALTDALTGTR